MSDDINKTQKTNNTVIQVIYCLINFLVMFPFYRLYPSTLGLLCVIASTVVVVYICYVKREDESSVLPPTYLIIMLNIALVTAIKYFAWDHDGLFLNFNIFDKLFTYYSLGVTAGNSFLIILAVVFLIMGYSKKLYWWIFAGFEFLWIPIILKLSCYDEPYSTLLENLFISKYAMLFLVITLFNALLTILASLESDTHKNVIGKLTLCYICLFCFLLLRVYKVDNGIGAASYNIVSRFGHYSELNIGFVDFLVVPVLIIVIVFLIAGKWEKNCDNLTTFFILGEFLLVKLSVLHPYAWNILICLIFAIVCVHINDNLKSIDRDGFYRKMFFLLLDFSIMIYLLSSGYVILLLSIIIARMIWFTGSTQYMHMFCILIVTICALYYINFSLIKVLVAFSIVIIGCLAVKYIYNGYPYKTDVEREDKVNKFSYICVVALLVCLVVCTGGTDISIDQNDDKDRIQIQIEESGENDSIDYAYYYWPRLTVKNEKKHYIKDYDDCTVKPKGNRICVVTRTDDGEINVKRYYYPYYLSTSKHRTKIRDVISGEDELKFNFKIKKRVRDCFDIENIKEAIGYE